MEITGIILEKLRNDEYFQFMTDTQTIIRDNDPVLLNVKPSYDALSIELTEIDKLFKKEQGSVITPKMELADLRRDRALNGINSLINGYTYHFQPDLAEPAKLLQASIGKYGSNIIGQSLIAETSIISNLIGDWTNKPELQDAVRQLNLQSWSEELNVANQEFNQLFIQRNAEYGSKTTQSMDERRSLISNSIYYKLRDKLLANAELNDLREPWGKTVNQLRSLIATYNNLLAARAAEAVNAPAPPTPPQE